MKPIVYLADTIPEAALELLRNQTTLFYAKELETKKREEILREAAGILIPATVRIDAAFLDAAPQLRVVSTRSVGYDHLDIVEMKRRGVIGTHTPDVLSASVAELTIALLLSAARRVCECDAKIRSGGWKQNMPEDAFFGLDLAGRTLGLVGMGRIAVEVARRAKAGFGMDLIYHARHAKPEVERTLGAVRMGLRELLKQADFVVVLAALTEETRSIIGASELALMKPSAILVNTGRGALVDEAALTAALRERKIRGAGLDVFEREPLPENSPLLSLDNVVLTPHIASATARTRLEMSMLAARNLVNALYGKPIPALIPEFRL